MLAHPPRHGVGAQVVCQRICCTALLDLGMRTDPCAPLLLMLHAFCRAGLVLVLLAVGVNLIISTSQLGA